MFISIPKEFFVPVIFGENFLLNFNNQNMELDTESNRVEHKYAKDDSNYNMKDDGEIYAAIDEEYVNAMTDNPAIGIRTNLEDFNREELIIKEVASVECYDKETRRA